jgi:putative heme-binding domain-containing protein
MKADGIPADWSVGGIGCQPHGRPAGTETRARWVAATVRGAVWSAALLALLPGTAAAAQQRYVPAEVESGGRLFTSSCTGCHGPEGDWIGGVNFSKGQFRRSTSDDDLVRVIMRGIPNTPMPPSSFSDGQAATIVAYIRSLASTSGAPSSGDAGRGKALFEGKGQCLTCHAVSGTGSRTAPALTEIGSYRTAADLQRSIFDPDADIRAENREVRATVRGAAVKGRLLNQDTFTLQIIDANGDLRAFDKSDVHDLAVLKTSSMPSYRDKLTMQEVADVVSYLASLRGRP